MTVALQYFSSMAEKFLARRPLKSVVSQSHSGASYEIWSCNGVGRLFCRATPGRVVNHHSTQSADDFLSAGGKFRASNRADFAVRFFLFPHRGKAGRKQRPRIEKKFRI